MSLARRAGRGGTGSGTVVGAGKDQGWKGGLGQLFAKL